MKKIFFIATLFLTTLSFAQSAPLESRPPVPPKETKVEKTETKESNWGEYISFSASFSNQEGMSTLQSTYACLEAGVFYKNLSGGIGVGKTLQASYFDDESVDPTSVSYYIEPRFLWNVVDLTAFKAGPLVGFGTYLAPDKPFIREYGIGTELDSDYINYTLQFSNWGTASYNANYISFGITKTF
jgi:hypothetical protein